MLNPYILLSRSWLILTLSCKARKRIFLRSSEQDPDWSFSGFVKFVFRLILLFSCQDPRLIWLSLLTGSWHEDLTEILTKTWSNLSTTHFIILRGSLIGCLVNPGWMRYFQLRKMSVQELEEILNRVLFHLEKSWKKELPGFKIRSYIKLDRILEIQNPERSVQGFSRNE